MVLLEDFGLFHALISLLAPVKWVLAPDFALWKTGVWKDWCSLLSRPCEC